MKLSVEKMVYGGYGISRTPEGKLIFVRGALKGETVEARIEEDKGDYAFAVVDDVIQASPYRVSARCQFFGLCGGCDWQYISYEGQLLLKREVLEDVFERIAKVRLEPELVSSSQPWGYRYRVRFHADHRGRLGFFKRGSNELVWVGSCPVLVSDLNEAKQTLDGVGAFDKGMEVSLRCSYGKEKGDILIHTDRRVKKVKRNKLRELPFFIVEDGVILKGNPYLEEKWCDLRLRFSYGSFSQVNPAVAEELYLFIFKEVKEFEKIWYLYSGVGVLGVLLALDGKEVKLIEANESAVKDAQENLKRYGVLGKAEIIRGDVEEVFSELYPDFGGDALIVDPPREGVSISVIETLKGSSIRKVVYVSCNPPVLARDVTRLREVGYELEGLRWIDMFPQTSHIEAIGIFCKKGGG